MSLEMRALTPDEVSYFCYQLATILDSGVPIYDGLTVMAAEAKEKSTAEANMLLESITASLSMEMPLYKAMENTDVFPLYCVKTVMAGELSGKLHEALSGLAEYYEKEAKLREDIKNAVVSPLVMLVVASAVIAVLVVKVLPMFADIFADYDPQIYATVSESVRIAGIAGSVMLGICGAAVLISAVAYVLMQGRASAAARAAAFFPLTRRASEAVALARFSSAVSMMIESGLSAAEAMENAREISYDPRVNKRIDACTTLLVEDMPFSEAIDKSGLLPVFYAQTLRVAYRSGSFDSAWKKVSEKLNDEADSEVRYITAAAEPAMAVLLTASAAVIMLTVMIPLMNVMTAL